MASSSSSGLVGSGLIILIVVVVLGLAYTVLNIVAVVKIIRKAGYSGAWFLILFVPVVGTIMFYVFAFSKWPVQRRLEAMINNRPPMGRATVRAVRLVSERRGPGGHGVVPRGRWGARKVHRLRKVGHRRPQQPLAPYIPPWDQ